MQDSLIIIAIKNKFRRIIISQSRTEYFDMYICTLAYLLLKRNQKTRELSQRINCIYIPKFHYHKNVIIGQIYYKIHFSQAEQIRAGISEEVKEHFDFIS